MQICGKVWSRLLRKWLNNFGECLQGDSVRKCLQCILWRGEEEEEAPPPSLTPFSHAYVHTQHRPLGRNIQMEEMDRAGKNTFPFWVGNRGLCLLFKSESNVLFIHSFHSLPTCHLIHFLPGRNYICFIFDFYIFLSGKLWCVLESNSSCCPPPSPKSVSAAAAFVVVPSN